MNLQSKLFRGDSKLEAAAVSDPAHITPGTCGPHVAKIQQALNVLDGAAIAQDGKYGRATAAAVLAYKRKRNIINTSYETQADDIVGKMTIASLDREIFKKENAPGVPVQIRPLAYARIRPPRSGLPASFRNPSLLARNVAAVPKPIGNGPPIILPLNQFLTLELPEHGVGSIQVINCVGGTVESLDENIGRVFDPADPAAHGARHPSLPTQIFNVRAGLPGRTLIEAVNRNASPTFLGSHAFLDLVVQNPRAPTNFVDGVNHGHRESGRWQDIRTYPQPMALDALDLALGALARISPTPEAFMAAFRDGLLRGTLPLTGGNKPLAVVHLDWFLREGGGNNFVEDSNIENWLFQDEGIRAALRFEIFRGDPSRKDKPNLWKTSGRFFFDQTQYKLDNFRFSFGAIDNVFYQLDFGDGSIHVWFKDRYEWHPVFREIYGPPCSEVRNSNYAHAAGVESKAGTARDYWMVGEAFVPMSLIIDEV